ncbi:MAG: glycosyltransferase family 9 protein [Chlorobium limicola]|uniref:Glycosyl transferase family 9 n=1 Tax=Chlorobium limicola (strain DSM 245 / NBRC 103803 / 6330) TaxID=290315 RepID=B3EEB0_CHLL2|nr:glycosyltransferase family 9 protein [Chlorobium limicola]ACD89244.1 glycosyl transferase family 9 [Chlorobium limicola DSM 245]NTV21356.1 glycosyltransferase family 9 protein [Chlorobium limicola]
MDAVKKILVIRLSSIGDIILTTPLLREVSAAFPGARIDYCVKSPLFVVLLTENPNLHALYTLEAPPSGSYDLVIDFQNNLRSRRLVATLQAGRVIRYRKRNWKKLLLVKSRIDLTGPYRSVVDRYRDSLSDCKVKADALGCELYPSAADRSFAHSLPDAGGFRLAVCFGAMHASKRYPPVNFAAVLSALFTAMPVQAVLLGGADDAPYAELIMQALPERFRQRVVDLAGKCALMQSAAVLECSDAVLTNDTGLMHMASAFGKKLFVLFGSSVAAFGFLPYHTKFELFEVSGLRCRPCSHIGRDRCPEGHFRCMNDIDEGVVSGKIIDYFNTLRS